MQRGEAEVLPDTLPGTFIPLHAGAGVVHPHATPQVHCHRSHEQAMSECRVTVETGVTPQSIDDTECERAEGLRGRGLWTYKPIPVPR
jgi:hypothetical protein